MTDFDETKQLWFDFNLSANKLSDKLRTRNLVGEYAEWLAAEYYGAKLLPVSESSADLIANNGVKYQVKARRQQKLESTQLSIIRSWNFDFLVVILFDLKGNLIKVIESPMKISREHAKPNSRQNGWVITTSKKFLNDPRNKDITNSISKLNGTI
ncbi:hypothetical protein ELS82_25380 [Vibrio ouci]|uniref:DUF6998 domain-containing protein n=2 Tax=Vibrio ouci TaxID=2499078 RepID=A0A4Y8W8E7_9VIBR|nr:hypothetical protein ELS82_25380 [Vibrio ouci]